MGLGSTGATTFYSHWKRMEIWVGLLIQTFQQATISGPFIEIYRCPKPAERNTNHHHVSKLTVVKWIALSVIIIKVIFFFTSQIKIYWLNVSILFFLFIYNKTSSDSGEVEVSSIFFNLGWGWRGVVSYNNGETYPFHNSYLADVMMTDKTIHFTIDNKQSNYYWQV
jgi:hypothetical protein